MNGGHPATFVPVDLTQSVGFLFAFIVFIF